MRLFGRDQPDPERERRERSAAELAAGRLPLAAVERLGRERDPAEPFSSDLSVAEFLLTQRAGLEPITQVMGACTYHVGWYALGSGIFAAAGEVRALTDAYNEGRRRAVARLRQEAELAGAGLVCGVRVEGQEHEWGEDLVEFTAIGTACRTGQGSQGPALTSLSGQDVALLLAGGYQPVGIVGATSVYYAYADWRVLRSLRQSWRNVELEQLTRGWYEARRLVMGRLRAQAAALAADGIVGVDWRQSQRPDLYESGGSEELNGITFAVHALATAIRRRPAAAALDISTMLDL